MVRRLADRLCENVRRQNHKNSTELQTQGKERNAEEGAAHVTGLQAHYQDRNQATNCGLFLRHSELIFLIGGAV
jgi:hypothetical protein